MSLHSRNASAISAQGDSATRGNAPCADSVTTTSSEIPAYQNVIFTLSSEARVYEFSGHVPGTTPVDGVVYTGLKLYFDPARDVWNIADSASWYVGSLPLDVTSPYADSPVGVASFHYWGYAGSLYVLGDAGTTTCPSGSSVLTDQNECLSGLRNRITDDGALAYSGMGIKDPEYSGTGSFMAATGCSVNACDDGITCTGTTWFSTYASVDTFHAPVCKRNPEWLPFDLAVSSLCDSASAPLSETDSGIKHTQPL